jgi:hypothetical protein
MLSVFRSWAFEDSQTWTWLASATSHTHLKDDGLVWHISSVSSPPPESKESSLLIHPVDRPCMDNSISINCAEATPNPQWFKLRPCFSSSTEESRTNGTASASRPDHDCLFPRGISVSCHAVLDMLVNDDAMPNLRT